MDSVINMKKAMRLHKALAECENADEVATALAMLCPHQLLTINSMIAEILMVRLSDSQDGCKHTEEVEE